MALEEELFRGTSYSPSRAQATMSPFRGEGALKSFLDTVSIGYAGEHVQHPQRVLTPRRASPARMFFNPNVSPTPAVTVSSPSPSVTSAITNEVANAVHGVQQIQEEERSELEALRQENSLLRAKMASPGQLDDVRGRELHMAMIEMSHLKSLVSSRDRTIDALRDRIAEFAHTQNDTDLYREIDRHQLEASEAKILLQAKERETTALEGKLKEATEELERRSGVFKDLEREFNSQRDLLQEEIDRSTNNEKKITGENLDLCETIKSLKADIAQLTQSRNEFEKQSLEYKVSIDEMEAAQEKNRKKQSDWDRYDENLRAMKAKYEEEIRSLRTQLEKLGDVEKDSYSKEKVKAWWRQVDAMKSDWETLNNEKDSLIDEYKQKLTKSKVELSSVMSTKAALEKEVTTLKENTTKRREELAHTVSLLKETQGECRELQETNRRLIESLNRSKSRSPDPSTRSASAELGTQTSAVAAAVMEGGGTLKTMTFTDYDVSTFVGLCTTLRGLGKKYPEKNLLPTMIHTLTVKHVIQAMESAVGISEKLVKAKATFKQQMEKQWTERAKELNEQLAETLRLKDHYVSAQEKDWKERVCEAERVTAQYREEVTLARSERDSNVRELARLREELKTAQTHKLAQTEAMEWERNMKKCCDILYDKKSQVRDVATQVLLAATQQKWEQSSVGTETRLQLAGVLEPCPWPELKAALVEVLGASVEGGVAPSATMAMEVETERNRREQLELQLRTEEETKLSTTRLSDEMRQRMTVMEAKVSEHAAIELTAKQRAEDLATQVMKADGEISSLHSRLEESESQRVILQNGLAVAQNQLRSVQESLNASEGQRRTLEENLRATEKHLHEKSSAVAVGERDFTELQEAFAAEQRQCIELRESLSSTKQQLEKNKKESEGLTQALHQLQEELDREREHLQKVEAVKDEGNGKPLSQSYFVAPTSATLNGKADSNMSWSQLLGLEDSVEDRKSNGASGVRDDVDSDDASTVSREHTASAPSPSVSPEPEVPKPAKTQREAELVDSENGKDPSPFGIDSIVSPFQPVGASVDAAKSKPKSKFHSHADPSLSVFSPIGDTPVRQKEDERPFRTPLKSISDLLPRLQAMSGGKPKRQASASPTAFDMLTSNF